MERPNVFWESQHKMCPFKSINEKSKKQWLRYYYVTVHGLEGNSLKSSVCRKYKDWENFNKLGDCHTYNNVVNLYEKEAAFDTIRYLQKRDQRYYI